MNDAARLQIEAVSLQTAAIEQQNLDLKRAERRRDAQETLQAARMLDASLQIIYENITAAKGKYHTDDNNHIIDKGDATPIRSSINKPGFPFLWQHLGILHHAIPALFMTLEIKIDELHVETQDTTFGGLMGKLDRLAEIVSSLRNLVAQNMNTANAVLADPAERQP